MKLCKNCYHGVTDLNGVIYHFQTVKGNCYLTKCPQCECNDPKEKEGK